MAEASSVDHFIELHPEWNDALVKLRRYLTARELRHMGVEETMKWGAPCYTVDGKNVISLVACKSYVGLWFHQGAFLADREKVLINADEEKTRGLRQWRFHTPKEIRGNVVKTYIREAFVNQKEGKAIEPLRQIVVEAPPELVKALDQDKAAGLAYRQLTPGRRKEYAEFIASAKRPTTKETRLEKILPLIRAGKGLNDRYRNR